MMKMEGGDASDYAISVYGGIGQQHAVSDNNHVIAMNKVDGLMKGGAEMTATPTGTGAVEASSPTTSMTPAALTGGKVRHEEDEEEDEDKEARLQGGDSVLADLAVPAVLLVANQAMRKKGRKTSKKSRKNRRYRKKRSAKRRR